MATMGRPSRFISRRERTVCFPLGRESGLDKRRFLAVVDDMPENPAKSRRINSFRSGGKLETAQ
jgi:hypothetical protein